MFNQKKHGVIVFAILALVLRCTDAWWDDHCSEGGQCASMIKSYESLIRGEGCRSFYVTGKCSRICTYSLKSLIGRPTWMKCADRCEWSKAAVAGASSWLDMCISLPADDVFQTEEEAGKSSKGASDGKEGMGTIKGVSGLSREAMTKKGPSLARTMLRCLLILAGLGILTVAAVTAKPSLKGSLDSSCRQVLSWVQKLRGKPSYGSRTAPGKGPLDVGPDRKELRNLQRGARRHLKALRKNLD